MEMLASDMLENMMSPGAIAASNLMLLSTPPSETVCMLSPMPHNDVTSSCKRKIDFADAVGSYSGHRGYLHQRVSHKSKHPTTKLQTPSVVRRNERERNRVRLVNMGFATLRQHVPEAIKNKKLSKVDTLKAAADYIKHLQDILDESNAMQSGAVPQSTRTRAVPASPHGSLDENTPSPEGYTSDSSNPDSTYPDSVGGEDRGDLSLDFNLFM